MSDPAVVAAVITGAVSFVAIVATSVTTWITLRHQRKAEDKRREHERHMRLLESTLKAAVDFLAAADRTTHTRQGLVMAADTLGNAKQSADQQTYDQLRLAWEAARDSNQAAIADAENAYSALRLLIPAAADQARCYLDLCISADAHPDTKKAERQQAQETVEETLRQEVGDPQIQESPRRRWWQILRRSHPQGIEAPRQPGS
jgi:hypothetical protein